MVLMHRTVLACGMMLVFLCPNDSSQVEVRTEVASAGHFYQVGMLQFGSSWRREMRGYAAVCRLRGGLPENGAVGESGPRVILKQKQGALRLGIGSEAVTEAQDQDVPLNLSEGGRKEMTKKSAPEVDDESSLNGLVSTIFFSDEDDDYHMWNHDPPLCSVAAAAAAAVHGDDCDDDINDDFRACVRTRVCVCQRVRMLCSLTHSLNFSLPLLR